MYYSHSMQSKKFCQFIYLNKKCRFLCCRVDRSHFNLRNFENLFRYPLFCTLRKVSFLFEVLHPPSMTFEVSENVKKGGKGSRAAQ